jgi:hypothetical protein
MYAVTFRMDCILSVTESWRLHVFSKYLQKSSADFEIHVLEAELHSVRKHTHARTHARTKQHHTTSQNQEVGASMSGRNRLTLIAEIFSFQNNFNRKLLSDLEETASVKNDFATGT